MRNHRTTAALNAIVGPDSNRYSARQIASAERELGLRASGEQSAFERKVRLSANACAIVGGFCILWPLLVLTLYRSVDPPVALPSDPGTPFLFRNFDTLFTALGILQAFCGVLLLLGGLATRARRSAGPVLISIVLGIVALYIVSFSVVMVPTVAKLPLPFFVFFVGVMLVQACLFLVLLWLPLRFFLSSHVREFCRSVV